MSILITENVKHPYYTITQLAEHVWVTFTRCSHSPIEHPYYTQSLYKLDFFSIINSPSHSQLYYTC